MTKLDLGMLSQSQLGMNYKANVFLRVTRQLHTSHNNSPILFLFTMPNSDSSGGPGIRLKYRIPSWLLVKLLLAVMLVSPILQESDGQLEEDWCIADEQFLDAELQKAMDWACGNGADCSKIQPNQPCYLPNTVKDHASYAFNSYYQKMKHKGGSCYFNAAAILTALDPSHGSCKFEVLP